MLQDEGPGTPRRSTPTTTATSGLPYLPANPYPDDAFRTPVRPTSTGTATSTSPQPRTTQGRQGLARQEDVWSQDAETAIFSIYSMYGVSVRDSVVPGETSIQQPTRQSIVDTPSTSTTTPLRASQIGPTDVVHPLGGTFPGTSAALHGRYQQHQYHDRRPTKEQFEAFSFGSSGQPAPRQISRFSEDTSSAGITRESMYSSDTAHFATGAGFVPGSSSPPTSGDEGRPVSMVSEEGTIESAVVMRVPGSTNSANPPPSAFHLDGQDWVSANPRLSFQLGTVLTAPATQYDAEGRQDLTSGQSQKAARPESRLTLDLDPVVPQDAHLSSNGAYSRHRLLSATSGSNLPNTALATPTTAESVYGTPLSSPSPSEPPFFTPANPQSPPLTAANRRDMIHREDYGQPGQPWGTEPTTSVGLGISQPPRFPSRPDSAKPITPVGEEYRGHRLNGTVDSTNRHHESQRGLEMHAHRQQPLSPSSRPSSQYHPNHTSVNGSGTSAPNSSTAMQRTSRPPSPNQQQYQRPLESTSPRRSGPAQGPMVVNSPNPVYPPSSYNSGHSPSRPPSRSRTPQSHSPGPSRTGTPVRVSDGVPGVDGASQALGAATNGISHHGPIPKTPSKSQLRQVHTLSNALHSPSPSRISHSAQSSASTTHRNPSPSYNTPHISYSPPPKSDPSPLQTYPPISVSRMHSRQESSSTASHTPSQVSQTPSTQYSIHAPSTQSHQYSQHSSTSTGASQSQYQPSLSNGYYQNQMQYEDRSFESKESPPPPLPEGNRALQLHLAVHNGAPPRPSSSKNASSGSINPPALRGKRSAASLAPSLVPSLVPSIGEEPDAFHVRNTYAQLEMFGVKGDGYEEGVERTRAARSRAAESSQPKTASVYSRPEAFQRTKSQVLADDAIADDNEKRRELKPEEVKLLSSVDRYGFFTVSTHERYVVMPSQPLLKPFTASSQSSPSPSANGPPAPKSLNCLPIPSPNPKEMARITKWNKMLVPHARDEGGNVQAWRVRPSKVAKVRGRVYKGVPDRWRAAVWEMLMSAYVIGHEGNSRKSVDVPRLTSSSEAATRGVQDVERSAREYREGIEKPSTYDVQIDLDVPRTISGHIMFRTRYGAGQRSLFHVLHAFSLVCSECGYVQGMGPIAATLLSYLPPSLSYTALVRLHTSYNMHTIFSPGFPGLLEAIYVQEQITKTYMPNVYEAFKKHMISTTSYATKWYITLFAGVVPWQVMLRLWDVFWLEGADVFVGLAVGVLWAFRDQITSPQANFETVLSLLSSFFVPEDEDVLLSWLEKMLGDAKLRSSMKTWRIQWQELVRTGKEGDALL